jgi:hypothetical protein
MDKFVQNQDARAKEEAEDDLRFYRTGGNSINPFSTYGARTLWQQGWDGVRPANLVAGSTNWSTWRRGYWARQISEGGHHGNS